VRRSGEAEIETDVSVSIESDMLQTRVIDGKKYVCTAAEFERIHHADRVLTKRQQSMDFAAQCFPYILSALVLVAGVVCVLTGNPEPARWLWGGAGLGTGGSVTAAGIRHVAQRRAAARLEGGRRTRSS
jgi:hypothetical protein